MEKNTSQVTSGSNRWADFCDDEMFRHFIGKIEERCVEHEALARRNGRQVVAWGSRPACDLGLGLLLRAAEEPAELRLGGRRIADRSRGHPKGREGEQQKAL